MRRRRGRSRLIGLMIGAAFLGGLTLPQSTMSPEPSGAPDPTSAPAVGGVALPGQTAAIDTNDPAVTPPGKPSPASAQSAFAADVMPTGDALLKISTPGEPTQTVEARPGDTPLKLLARIGVAPEDAQAAVRTLSTVWDPRYLKAGQKAAIFVQSDRLLSIRLALSPDRDVVVARDDNGGFVVEDQDRPTRQVAALATGTIRTSLSEAASRAGLPAGCSAR